MTQEEDARTSARFQDTIERIAALIAIVPLVSGLLYFLGSTSADSYYDYFDIDPDMLNLSTTQYVLRGVGIALFPIGLLLILLLLLAWIHPRVERLTMAFPMILTTMSLAGGALFAFSLFQFFPRTYSSLSAPLYAAFGVLLIAYAGYLRRSGAVKSDKADPWAGRSGWPVRAFAVLAILVATYFVFYTGALYANEFGRSRAERMHVLIPLQPAVTVCTSHKLEVLSPAIRTKKISANEACYSGLRLLEWSDGRYFLVPADWSRPNGAVIILSDSDETRVAVGNSFR
jgi:hypothetical protein